MENTVNKNITLFRPSLRIVETDISVDNISIVKDYELTQDDFKPTQEEIEGV